MKIKCVVICSNASGEPDVCTTTITVTQEQYDNGDHYEKAKAEAIDAGYEGTMVVIDQNDNAQRFLRAAKFLNEK